MDGNYIHVHKDFYCYLTIRGDNKPRFYKIDFEHFEFPNWL